MDKELEAPKKARVIMGSIMAKATEETFRKNQEFMIASQRAQVERQLQMQNALREQQMAVQIARSRDLFMWWAAFYAVAGTGCLAGFKHSRNRAALIPLLPLTFIVGFIGDMAYGTKMTRIKGEAASILESERHLLDLPQPLPTIEQLDRLRDQYWRK